MAMMLYSVGEARFTNSTFPDIGNQQFLLTNYLSKLSTGSFATDCNDNTNFLTVVAASLGVAVSGLFLDDGNGDQSELTHAPYYGAGSDTQTPVGGFKFHQIVKFGGTAADPNVYDPSLAKDPSDLHTAVLLSVYWQAIFPGENGEGVPRRVNVTLTVV